MTFQLFGLPVSRGIAIGRAVLVASSRIDVAHYYVGADAVEAEIDRLRVARDAVAAGLAAMKNDLPAEAPAELSALLDVHLMLLHDESLTGATKQWIRERHYNAEWALSAQLEVLARQFDEMEDEYLRERKADLEQVVERLLGVLARGEDGALPLVAPSGGGDPLVLALGLDLDLGADACGQHHHAHDALGIDAAPVAAQVHLAAETAGQLGQLGRGAGVQTQLIADGDGRLDH